MSSRVNRDTVALTVSDTARRRWGRRRRRLTSTRAPRVGTNRMLGHGIDMLSDAWRRLGLVVEDDSYEKSSTCSTFLAFEPACHCRVGWCAFRLLRLHACARGSTTGRHADQGDHRSGRADADVPDL